MAKKHKIKNEDPSINFRLPEELKAEIYKEAHLKNKTVSNFLRDHLAEFMDGSLYEREISYYRDNSFIHSTEFLQLITWVLSKRINSNCVASNEQLDGFIQTIKRMDFSTPKDLVKEFDKVLADLVRVRNETGAYRIFYFCGIAGMGETFNYNMLENYLLKVLKPNQVVGVSASI